MKEEILTELNEAFLDSQIKTRMLGTKELKYVDGASYIKRLNDVFKGDWSFKIIDRKVSDDEVVILGELSHGDIVHADVGCIERHKKKDGSGYTMLIGDCLKSAVTDCLKRCSHQFGVGLHLYSDGDPAPSGATKKEEKIRKDCKKEIDEDSIKEEIEYYPTSTYACVTDGCGKFVKDKTLKYSLEKYKEPVCFKCQKIRENDRPGYDL